MIRHRMLAAVLSLMASLALASAPAADPAKISSASQDDNTIKVLRTTNKAQTNKYVCAALRFDHVNPYDVINFFWAATSREEGGIYSFVHPSEPRGYIVVICPEYQLSWLRNLARELDRPKLTSAPGSKYIYYRMVHRNVADPGFRTVVSYYEGASGVILPDIETNSMVIFDAPAGAASAEKALKDFLDQPLLQVQLDLSLYEIDVHNGTAIGLDYEAWKNGPGKNLAQFSSRGRYFKASGTGTISSSETGSGVYLDYPSAYFDFLVDKGKAKSLVNTKITAVNGVPALLTSGEQFSYFDVTNTATDREVQTRTTDLTTGGMKLSADGSVLSGSDKPLGGGGLRGTIRSPFRTLGLDKSYPQRQYPQNNRPISSSVASADAGVRLALVPTIGEQMVNLDLNLSVVSVNGFDNEGTPLLNSRQIKESIAVPNGAEVIFGGLTRESKVQTTNRVPFFGALPVIGSLFGHENTLESKNLVVASITPHLVINSDNIEPMDDKLAHQAGGDEVVVLPESEFSFDQACVAQR